jgi:hypothetical protein
MGAAQDVDATARASGGSPRLSVVIVNWNGEAYLEACLASVVRRGHEVIVVDNGSSDASEASVRRFRGVVWLPLGANLGFATAANRGLERARGSLVLFLNPDARASDEAIEAAARTLEENPQVGLVSVAVRDARGHVTPTVEPFFSLGALLRGRWYDRVSAPSGPGPVPIDWCHGAFFLARRDELLALRGYDERYFLYSEDMDLCFRMHELGRSVVYLPQVSIVHHGNLAGEAAFGERRAAAIFASAMLFYAKRHGWLAQLALRLAAGVTFGVRALYLAIAGSPLAVRYRSLAYVALRGPSAAPYAALRAARPAGRESSSA